MSPFAVLPDYVITPDPDGSRHAFGLNVPIALSVLPDAATAPLEGLGAAHGAGQESAPAKLFKRNAVKNFGTANPTRICWLVGELDGVRAYVMPQDGIVRIVLTRQDLQP